MRLRAEVSKRFYSSKAKGSNVHYFTPPIGTVLNRVRLKTTTSASVGSSGACVCGNGCMSRDGGFEAMRAAGKKLQIRTLLKTKHVFIG